MTLQNFQVLSLQDTMANKKGYILNAGGSIWGLDFVPQSTNVQYLTIGGYNTSHEHHYLYEQDNIQPNAIQLWKCCVDSPPQLDMCILHTLGVVFDLKWCPLNLYKQNVKYIYVYIHWILTCL